MLGCPTQRVLIPPSLSPALLQAYPASEGVQRLCGKTMGTVWSVDLVVSDSSSFQAIRADLEQALDTVIKQMSTWFADSDICRFNRAPARTWRRLPEEMFEVLSCALNLARDTEGAYDPTVGTLVNLWGFGAERSARREPPAATLLSAARAHSGWKEVTLDPAQRRALQPGGVCLDFSGIAKGFAVDLLAARLDASNVAHYLIEIGGELRGRGCKPDGQPWWVGVEWPESSASGLAQTLAALHDLSSATSGDYRRYFADRGQHYSHTIDPRTGQPVDRCLASVTVFHASCMHADALATALTVLGAKDGMAYASRRNIAALFRLRTAAASVYEERLSPELAAYLD